MSQIDIQIDEPRVCERFSAPDADVTIKSSDGVLFKVHRKNLEMHSEGFPGDDVPTDDEIVMLSEEATVLELLFQYMYRQPQPDLAKVNFYDVAMLAEAVEKYRVFPAMEICKLHMRAAIPLHPMVVLAYASIHGYGSLCDEAAPLTIDMPVTTALAFLGPRSFVTWVLYRERWIDIVESAHTLRPVVLHKGGREDCDAWHPFHAAVLVSLGSNLGKLHDIESIFRLHRQLLEDCHHCRIRADQWQRLIEGQKAEVPQFSNFL